MESFEYFQRNFYTGILLILATLFALCAGRAHPLPRSQRLLKIYMAAALVSDLLEPVCVAWGVPAAQVARFSSLYANFFVCLEVGIFYSFFIANAERADSRRYLKFALAAFYLLDAARLLSHPAFLFDFHSSLYALDAVFICFAGVAYLLSIKPGDPAQPVRRQPGFWIALGSLFYFGGSLPLQCFPFHHLQDLEHLMAIANAVNYILYSGLFLFISIAAKCDRTI